MSLICLVRLVIIFSGNLSFLHSPILLQYNVDTCGDVAGMSRIYFSALWSLHIVHTTINFSSYMILLIFRLVLRRIVVLHWYVQYGETVSNTYNIVQNCARWKEHHKNMLRCKETWLKHNSSFFLIFAPFALLHYSYTLF